MCDGMNPTTNLLDGGKNYRDPSISPEGTRDTAPLDAEVAARNQQLVDQWADKLYDASAETITEWAAEHAPGRLAVTMSMENTVLAELAGAPDEVHIALRHTFIDYLGVKRWKVQRGGRR